MTDPEIQTSLRRMRDDLDALSDLIRGDGTPFSPGVVGVLNQVTSQTTENTSAIARILRTVDRVKWAVLGGAAVGGAIGGGLVSILTRIMGAE